ncbi:unnamed protein product [Caenorhabditis angaria]|uniref:Arrestin-like N-terminal domain-containing protein n=1 Tax=Caenorhabditis angaria TaxID=860376 RepID=A0A9P1MXA3_9PELO|nr:unnamed protein product [Caenorhabditis angaria]
MKILLLFLIFHSISCLKNKNNTYTFKLDNKDEVYAPNDKVTGKLIVKTSGEQKIDKIVIRFLGECYVAFNNAEQVIRSSIAPIVNDTKEYSDKQLSAKGKTLEYKFSFNIPPNALMSLEEGAHIRYSLIVEDKNQKVQDSYIITVINGIDLSKSTKPSEPSSCSGVSSTSGIKFTATIPQKTFIASDKIPVEIVVDNKSFGYAVESMEARLSVNITTYSAVNGKVFKGNEKNVNFEDEEKFWRSSSLTISSGSKRYSNHVSKYSKETNFTIFAENHSDSLTSISLPSRPRRFLTEPTIPNLPSFIKLHHYISVDLIATKDFITCEIPVIIAVTPEKSSKAKKLPIGKSNQKSFKPLYPAYEFDYSVEI